MLSKCLNIQSQKSRQEMVEKSRAALFVIGLSVLIEGRILSDFLDHLLRQSCLFLEIVKLS